ncbi:MAG TPA: anthranilate phosphoribosyltransferase [Longimicrobiaceae bacterium]|nr:anthranilate phosphoribosyltransferase [Longimicrobiaceae bacterium]
MSGGLLSGEAAELSLGELVRLATLRSLTAAEAERAFSRVMEGNATPVQMAALLVAIRVRGAVPEEVAGGVRALRRAMVPVTVTEPEGLVDTCGTGGGALTTFNISTAAALVAAGAGVRVAKHGNRSFTSRCGSADVLEALGVRLELAPDQEARVLEETGIVFMFAPLHHPAMRHVGPVRRELGMPTLMNVLGPLTNPALARRQVVGVSDPALLELIAGGLQALGHERALVVHGEPGMDELSPIGRTEIVELRGGELTRSTLDPRESLGWEPADVEGLGGSEPEENARTIERVLRGRAAGSARDAVALNAGAAVYVAGRAESLVDGIRTAEEALDDGAGWEKLEALRAATRR